MAATAAQTTWYDGHGQAQRHLFTLMQLMTAHPQHLCSLALMVLGTQAHPAKGQLRHSVQHLHSCGSGHSQG